MASLVTVHNRTCIGIVRGKWITQRKTPQDPKEHANLINTGPCCCEATV